MSAQVWPVDDSFAALRDIPDEAFDVTITDPPYNAHVQNNMMSGTTLAKVNLAFDPLASYEFAKELLRITKRWVIVFCAVEDFGSYRAAVGPSRYLRSGIWYKPNSMGQLTGDRPAAAYEGLAIMHREGKKKWNGRGSFAHWVCDVDELDSYFVCNGTRGEKGRHANQKPLNLCLELVAKFSERGETVFDPFAGSGRIGEACVLLGREYGGLERDLTWVDAANTRLEAACARKDEISEEQCLTLCRPKK